MSTEPEGDYSLLRAIESGDATAVRSVVSTDTEMATAFDDHGSTPLHYAVQLGNPEVVAALLETSNPKGLLNRFDGTSATPLALAASQGNYNIVKLLIEHGADV